MFFLRNKKNEKKMQILWIIVGVLTIGSMLLMYLPAFL